MSAVALIYRRSRKLIHKDRWSRIWLDRVQRQGRSREIAQSYAVIDRGNSVMVILTRGNDALMLRQFRYPAGKWLWEFPGGSIEKGEAPRQAAARELQEETGVSARELKKLCIFYEAPTYSSSRVYVYTAQSVAEPKKPAANDGALCRWIPLHTIERWSATQDAHTIAALAAYRGRKSGVRR